MKSSPVITWGSGTPEIKQDSIPSCADLQPYSIIEDLRTGNQALRPYATFEQDFWLLDGQYKFLPTADELSPSKTHVGMMSLSMSDAAGAFAVPVELVIDFLFPHSTTGLTLEFSTYTGDYANDIDISFYDADDVLIRSDSYVPADTTFETGQAVADFSKIIITFNSTNRPYRYLRLARIEYIALVEFAASGVRSASMVEEIDPISLELPFNTLDVKLYSADGDFNILDPAGAYAALYQYQPITAYEILGNEKLLMGLFFLDTWKNLSSKLIDFHCVDSIGVLDSKDYRDESDGVNLMPALIGDNWTLGAGWTIVDEILIADGATGDAVLNVSPLVETKTYRIRFEIEVTAGGLQENFGAAGILGYGSVYSSDYRIADGYWIGGTEFSFVPASGGFTGNIRNISVVEVIGDVFGLPYRKMIAVTLESLVTRVLTGVAAFAVDASLTETTVLGWIPITKYREALKLIAFSAGAYASCARDNVISFKPLRMAATDTDIDLFVTTADKDMSETLELKPLVTGVEIVAHDYTLTTSSASLITLFLESLLAGEYDFSFGQPTFLKLYDGCTISQNSMNHVLLTVPENATVELKGHLWKDKQTYYTVYTAGLDEKIKPNVLKIEAATLIYADIAQAAAQRVYDYHQQRIKQKMKLFKTRAVVGDMLLIDTLYGQKIRAVLTKMTTNLSGGFVSQAQATGVLYVEP